MSKPAKFILLNLKIKQRKHYTRDMFFILYLRKRKSYEFNELINVPFCGNNFINIFIVKMRHILRADCFVFFLPGLSQIYLQRESS